MLHYFLLHHLNLYLQFLQFLVSRLLHHHRLYRLHLVRQQHRCKRYHHRHLR